MTCAVAMRSIVDYDDVITVRYGKRRVKLYRGCCSRCGKDRGYQQLQQLKQRPLCLSCSHKLSAKGKAQRCRLHAAMRGKRRPPMSQETRLKIGERSANRGYSRQRQLEIRYKKRLAAAKKVGCASVSEFSLLQRIKRNLRARLNKALVKGYKSGSAVGALGCSVAELKAYLEAKMAPGMSWDNYGEWHIDHITPLCKFDLRDPEQVKLACHYSNLQPLWGKDNLEKRKHDGSF